MERRTFLVGSAAAAAGKSARDSFLYYSGNALKETSLTRIAEFPGPCDRTAKFSQHRRLQFLRL